MRSPSDAASTSREIFAPLMDVPVRASAPEAISASRSVESPVGSLQLALPSVSAQPADSSSCRLSVSAGANTNTLGSGMTSSMVV